MEAPLANHSAQSSLAGVRVASPEHAMGNRFKLKCALCNVQKVRRSLHWVLWLGWAGGLWALWFC